MELKYRGVSYRTFPTSVRIEGKKNRVCFRGCSYTLTDAVVNLSKSNQSEIVYRGIANEATEERRFLGNKYLVHTTKLAPVIS